MRIIALMNQKGGVGKTTTTANLGAALAELGQRVCIIDLDPQAHLTINYGIDPKPGTCSIYDVLVEDKSFLEAVQEVGTNIAVVPSSIDLAGAEVEMAAMVGREMLLKIKIESAEYDFDYLLIDCPPSLGLLTINALAVAGEVIIPMQPQFLALQGVAKLLETVQLVNRRMNPKLKVAGIVLTMFDAQTKLTGEVLAELEGFIEQAKGKPLPWAGATIYRSKIRRNIKLAESPSFGQTILQYDSSSHGAADYRALAAEVAGIEVKPSAAVTPAVAKVVPPVEAKPVVAAAAPAKPAVVVKTVKAAPTVAATANAAPAPVPSRDREAAVSAPTTNPLPVRHVGSTPGVAAPAKEAVATSLAKAPGRPRIVPKAAATTDAPAPPNKVEVKTMVAGAASAMASAKPAAEKPSTPPVANAVARPAVTRKPPTTKPAAPPAPHPVGATHVAPASKAEAAV